MRRGALMLAVLVLVVSGVPAAAGPEDRLEQAEDKLETVADRLAEAREVYAAAQARLTVLHTRLRRVEHQLAEARTADQRARRTRARATARAERAATLLKRRRDTLSQRVTEIYKRRASNPLSAFAAALVTARDPHDLALAALVTQQAVEGDQKLIEAARTLGIRSRQAQRRADTAVRVAAARHAEVEALARRQRRLVDQAADRRRAQQRVIDRLTADQEAQQQLITELQRRLMSVEAVLREPQTLPFDQPAPGWASGLPAAGQRWAGAVDAAAARAGVDGRFFAALVWSESSFNPDAVSSAGAIGLAQLTPATAEELGVDPWDPIENLSGGARYLRDQLTRFWDLELGLGAYNAGPGRASQGSSRTLTETRLYVLTILERWQQLLE